MLFLPGNALAYLIPANPLEPRRLVIGRKGQTKLSGDEITLLLGEPTSEAIELTDGRIIVTGYDAQIAGNPVNPRATMLAAHTIMPGDVVCGDVLVSI